MICKHKFAFKKVKKREIKSEEMGNREWKTGMKVKMFVDLSYLLFTIYYSLTNNFRQMPEEKRIKKLVR